MICRLPQQSSKEYRLSCIVSKPRPRCWTALRSVSRPSSQRLQPSADAAKNGYGPNRAGRSQKAKLAEPADQRAEEEVLARLKSSIEMWAGEEQQCQVEQVDAETQFRTEDAKVKDLQDQLDKLDKVLAGYGPK